MRSALLSMWNSVALGWDFSAIDNRLNGLSNLHNAGRQLMKLELPL
jgi:hypothetical protein